MSDKKLTILGIVAVCMVIWAVVQSHISNKPKTASDKPAYLIQGLDPADIGSIVVGTGKDAVTLKRRARHFVVANKDDYPAVSGEISGLITSCLDIKTAELYTDNAANHKDLGVTEEDARSVVKFFKPGPNTPMLTGVIVGKTKGQAPGSYVRLASSDEVYVALEVPWIKNRAMDYIEQELISIERKDINSVTVSSPDEEYTLKVKEDGTDIVLEDLPAGKKMKSGVCNRVFTALTNLRFDDVMRNPALIAGPGQEPKESGKLIFDRQFVCRLKDSTVYTIRIAQKDGKFYITCNAAFTGKEPLKERRVESQEELKEKEDKFLALEKARKFSEKHQGWVYEIPEHKAKNLTEKLSDLLEEEPKEKPEETEKAGGE